MRWINKNKQKALNRQPDVIEYFALFPISINGEVRWLEKVKVQGYWYIGEIFFQPRFYPLSFLDLHITH